MQESYGEGVASHTGPKPCAGAREGMGEASAGVRAGPPSTAMSNAELPGLLPAPALAYRSRNVTAAAPGLSSEKAAFAAPHVAA